MTSTMNLLDAALSDGTSLPEWTRRLGLSKQALYNAKERGHLSPAIAGALAEEIGQDPAPWIVVAALESERDSTCKDRMLKRFMKSSKVVTRGLQKLQRKLAAAVDQAHRGSLGQRAKRWHGYS